MKATEKKKKGFAGKTLPFLLSFVLASFLSAGLYLWRGKWYWCLFPFLFFFLACFLLISRRRSKAGAEKEEDEEQFVLLFSYFSIFVQDGFNVFNALEAVIPYSKGRVRNHLEGLIRQIGEDKTLTPFLAFASRFASLEIKEVMLTVYQMVEQGSGGIYLVQFQRLFSKLSEQKRQRRERKHLERLDGLSFLPLLGAGISMLMLMLALLEIMGGMLNGL